MTPCLRSHAGGCAHPLYSLTVMITVLTAHPCGAAAQTGTGPAEGGWRPTLPALCQVPHWPLKCHVSRSKLAISPLKPVPPQIFPLVVTGHSVLSVGQHKPGCRPGPLLFLSNTMFT